MFFAAPHYTICNNIDTISTFISHLRMQVLPESFDMTDMTSLCAAVFFRVKFCGTKTPSQHGSVLAQCLMQLDSVWQLAAEHDEYLRMKSVGAAVDGDLVLDGGHVPE